MRSSFCEIYLVRHGETDWNAQGLLQGHSDIDLNEAGLSQALSLKEILSHIPFAAAFSSDLSRAKKTAEVIVSDKKAPLITTPALRERFAGPFEGRPFIELDNWMKQSAIALSDLSKEEYLSYKWHPSMETSSEVYHRFKTFLDQHIQTYFGSTILVVSHGGVIRSIVDHLHFVPKSKWIVANCGFVRLEATLESLHLKDHQGLTCKEIA